MRHGRPLLADSGWVHAAGMAGWIDGYNAALVDQQAPAPARAAAASATTVVTSTLARALSSAQALGRQPDFIEPVFCEAELPHARWTLFKLPPPCWALAFRLAWRCGYAGTGASYRATRQRAALAAERLVELAAHGPVLLVGHGIMNRLIAAELAARGWSHGSRLANRYWSSTTLCNRPSTYD